MTFSQLNKHHRRKVAKGIGAGLGGQAGGGGGFWGWINGIASGLGHFITGPLTRFTHITRLALGMVTDLFADYYEALWRAVTWWDRTIFNQFRKLITWRLRAEKAARQDNDARLLRLIYITTAAVLRAALAAVRRERTARRHAVGAAEARARREQRYMHQLIEREAASAYRTGYTGRVSVITRLLEVAVTRDPLLKDAVGLLIRGVLDFLSVDNPIARWAIGFALRDVIDHLGIDKAIGALAADLLAPLIGEPKPRDLPSVIRDISARLGKLEAWQAGFEAEGGPQVEQAGRTWRDMTSLAGDALILAFTVEAVIDPVAWAAAINDTLGALGNTVVTGAADLIRKA